jgi:hypothetical protein
MSIMGLGFGGGMGMAYCHMCASHQCHHILGGQQNMNNDLYYQMLRQAGAAQQQSISIASPGTISVSSGTGVTVGQTETKPNRKLLLLME